MVDPLSFHALAFNHTLGCLEHSDLLTVTTAGAPLERLDSEVVPTTEAVRDRRSIPHETDHRRNVCHNQQGDPAVRHTGGDLKSNYGLFNRNNVYIRSWSWNYRGCWHQTCPPMDTQQCFWVQSIAISEARKCLRVIIFRRCLATCWHWAICAPAADRSHGCHFSSTLSGIEPQFPVTRHRHGSQLYYHQPDRW